MQKLRSALRLAAASLLVSAALLLVVDIPTYFVDSGHLRDMWATCNWYAYRYQSLICGPTGHGVAFLFEVWLAWFVVRWAISSVRSVYPISIGKVVTQMARRSRIVVIATLIVLLTGMAFTTFALMVISERVQSIESSVGDIDDIKSNVEDIESWVDDHQ